MEFLFIIIGAITGFAFAWLLLKARFTGNTVAKTLYDKTISELIEQKTRHQAALEDNNALKSQIINLNKIIDEKALIINQLNIDLASLKKDVDHANQRLTEHKKEVEDLQDRFKAEFKNLATTIMEEKSERFTKDNRQNIDALLKPLGEQIRDFSHKVEQTYDKESKERVSLQKEIQMLHELNKQISEEASNLTKALKGESKTQGNWGEMILESILEKSGLIKGREYTMQESFLSDSGKRLQPDAIVYYPENRCVIIDAKVSLVAYERLTIAEETVERQQALKEHLNSVKAHIDNLSAKKYQDIVSNNALDFIMLFMPIEPAYLAALQGDSSLWQYAYDKRVLLISPTNLIAALKMIANLWQQNNQNKNVLEIAKQSGLLYEKFDGFVKDLLETEKKIKQAAEAHQNAMNKLVEGKGNLINRVEKIKSLGAKTEKSLPADLLEKAIDD